jgi:single-strand DNA-binding protein
MPSFNQIILVGHLGKAPEVKTSAAGKSVCSFSLATDDGYFVERQWKERVTWHRLVAFGKSADGVAQKQLAVGDLVMVSGPLVGNTYKNKAGQDVTQYDVHVNALKVLKRKNEQPQTQSAGLISEDDEPPLPF